MEKMIQLECEWCGKKFERKLKEQKYKLKKFPHQKNFCSTTCSSNDKGKHSYIEKCIVCYTEFKVLPKEKGRKFCSKPCSATFNNKKRANNGFTVKGKTIIRCCTKCTLPKIFKVGAPKSTLCDECKFKSDIKPKNCLKNNKPLVIKEKIIKIRNHKINKCKVCTNIIHHTGIYCDNCRPKPGSHKRSWNEIAFGQLCSKYWDCTFNKGIFNKWDADIVIPELTIAILWNGAWHYQNIMYTGKKGSLLQTQTRDKIKIKEIISLKYTPYIIQDMNKASWRKVEEEFKKLLYYIEQNNFKNVAEQFALNNLHGNFHDYWNNNTVNYT